MGLLVPRVPFLFQTIPEKRTQDPLELVLLTLYYNYLLLSPGAFEFLQIFDICEGDAVTVLLYFCEFDCLNCVFGCFSGQQIEKRRQALRDLIYDFTLDLMTSLVGSKYFFAPFLLVTVGILQSSMSVNWMGCVFRQRHYSLRM